MSTTLVTCRTLADVPFLTRLPRQAGRRYVVASDDPAVQAACKNLDFVAEVCWLEQMESVYRVAADVLRLLAAVNGWLRSLVCEPWGLSEDLLCWMQHVEGGYTTQRLQDATLLIRSYAGLFERHHVDQLAVCTRGKLTLADQLIVATARSRNIPVEIISDEAGILRRARRVMERGLKTVGGVPYRLALHCQASIRRKLVTMWAERHRTSQRRAARDRYVIFQLASAAEKHVENVTPLMDALNRRGFHAVAVTCFAPGAAGKVRESDQHAEELVTFLPLHAFLSGMVRVAVTFARAIRRKRRFLDDPALSYQGVALGRLLWPSIRDFLLNELIQRYCVQKALIHFFQVFPPVAMRPWGDVSLTEGNIAWHVSRQVYKPLLFDYWMGVIGESPYWRNDNPIDLFLTTGAVQEDAFTARGVSGDRVVSVGSLRYDGLTRLKQTYSPDASRREIGVPAGHDLHVFWDPNIVMRGYLTTQEQLLVAEAMLQVAANGCALIIKPHPSHRPGALERLLEAAPSPNVFRVPGAMLPYHALNAVDVVVTKYSTIALEAMLLDKPVISVLLDDEPKWRGVFGDAVEYMTETDDVVRLLRGFVDAPERRVAWVERRLAVQQSFVTRYFRQHSNSPVDLAADVIAERLERRRSSAQRDSATAGTPALALARSD
jgi:CDP-glycerol:poly(glycerophosphate) glycerophosphotransferase